MKNRIELKADGFEGERHEIVPRSIVKKALINPVTQDLLPTALGHFPHAAGHYVIRNNGLEYDDTILIYCSDGSGWYRINGCTNRLESGSAVLIPAGTAHSYGTTKKNPWTIYWVHFAGRQIEDYLKVLDITPNKPILHLQDMGEVLHHFEGLYGLLTNGYTSANLVALSTALANFLGQISLHKRSPTATGPDSIARVENTLLFMRQHLTSDVTIPELAKVASLSIPHYCTLFKNLTGQSPKALFLQLKMEKATHMLTNTNTSIKEIAAKLGIDDPYYFSRLFKKIVGKSPSEFRQDEV